MSENNTGICYFYVMDVAGFNHEDTFKAYYNMVPASRREKIDALIPPASKCLSLGAGVLLEQAKNRLDIRDDDISSVEETDRNTPFYYNLSHSGSRAVCAVSEVRVGCDVERIRVDEAHAGITIKVSRRFFTKAEAEHIEECYNIEDDIPELLRRAKKEKATETFYRYWTLKESVIKVTGQGLAMPLDSFEIDISGDEPGLKPMGDWTFLHQMDPEGFRLYEPYTEAGYAYGLCIASRGEYRIITEEIGPG